MFKDYVKDYSVLKRESDIFNNNISSNNTNAKTNLFSPITNKSIDIEVIFFYF
jgi:hypothetical protein